MLDLFDFFGHLGDCFEQVGDQAVVGDGENRRFFILVDCDDTFESFIPARCWIAPEIPIAM